MFYYISILQSFELTIQDPHPRLYSTKTLYHLFENIIMGIQFENKHNQKLTLVLIAGLAGFSLGYPKNPALKCRKPS